MPLKFDCSVWVFRLITGWRHVTECIPYLSSLLFTSSLQVFYPKIQFYYPPWYQHRIMDNFQHLRCSQVDQVTFAMSLEKVYLTANWPWKWFSIIIPQQEIVLRNRAATVQLTFSDSAINLRFSPLIRSQVVVLLLLHKALSLFSAMFFPHTKLRFFVLRIILSTVAISYSVAVQSCHKSNDIPL